MSQVRSMLPWPQGCRNELYSPNLAKMLAASNHLSILLQGLLHRNLDFPDCQHLIFRLLPHESIGLRAECGSRNTDGNTATVIDTRQILLLPCVRSLTENVCRSLSMMNINPVPSYALLNITFAAMQLGASSFIPVVIMHH